MTAEQFRTALKEIYPGITRRQAIMKFAKANGYSFKAAESWAYGVNPVPKHAEMRIEANV